MPIDPLRVRILMSFRGRLTLFFVAIVVVPMIAVGFLVVQVTEDSRDGKADAQIASGLSTAGELYQEALDEADREARRIANRPSTGVDSVALALNANGGQGNARGLEKLAEAEVEDGLIVVRFFTAEDSEVASAGSDDAIALRKTTIEADGFGRLGAIEVGVLDPEEFADRITELTGTPATVVSDAGLLGAAGSFGEAELPPTDGEAATVEGPDGEVRAASISLEGAPDGTRLALYSDDAEGFVASEPLVGVALVLFFGLALGFVLFLIRMLQGQIASMLNAARSIGEGDFSQKVPVEGDDEMAGLAREFNKMSDQLSTQMSELRRQREEIEQSVRRIGEAFASGLDREALLEILVETAIASCNAESGWIAIGSEAISAAGDDSKVVGKKPSADANSALHRAARQSVDRRGIAVVEVEGVHAIALPMTRTGEPDNVLGAMSICRAGEPFTDSEKDVLQYLIGQASVSVENISLHEQTAQQAVTDELTGLANNRHFRDWLANESARVTRFGGDLSLVLLDIDNFKKVNDTYGHLQGDEVLRVMGKVLRIESRGIDHPARYGGEEFVLALPETPKQGAIEVAERVRQRIAESVVDGVDGNDPMSVTASLGVATIPADASEGQALIAAADAALYRAKRTGKNKVVAADDSD